MTITLSVPETFRAAKKALDEGRLAAFHPDFQGRGRECAYRYEGYPGVACAVGVGMTDDQAETLKGGELTATVKGLQSAGALKVTGAISFLTRLQTKHDAILNNQSNGEVEVAARKKEFIDYLDKRLAVIDAQEADAAA